MVAESTSIVLRECDTQRQKRRRNQHRTHTANHRHASIYVVTADRTPRMYAIDSIIRAADSWR
jgi:hypothetical protein